MTTTGSIFQSVEMYPELACPIRHWQVIKREALRAQWAMEVVIDDRTEGIAWKAMPLLVEKEDQSVFSEEACRHGRQLLPETYNLFRRIPTVQALALSSLESGGHILPHCHENPFVTAALCLQEAGDAWICVNGEHRTFVLGQTLIFDYRCIHEVFNGGEKARIVLLILLNNKLNP